MENSGEKHDGGGDSEKWKSLYLHGFHEEKTEGHRRARTGNAKLLVSEGTRPTEEKGFAPGQSRSHIHRRRALSPGVFQSESKRRCEDLGILRSFTHGLNLGTGKPHNLNESSSSPCTSHSLSNVSESLDGGLVSLPVISKSKLSFSNVQNPSTWGGDFNVPRRPRGVFRRRNSPFNIKDAPALFTSIGKSSSGAHSGTLFSDLVTSNQPVQLLVENQNKACDTFDGNGRSGCDSLECFKWENGNSVQVIQKRAQRNHRKRHHNTTGKLKKLVSSQPFGNSSKCSNNCPEYDEESLEQNAARMLSSRFDPRCTGISGDKSGFSSISASKSSSAASSSLEIAGRVLRPRKQNDIGSFRKRRHFYEVCSTGVDPYWVLKRRIRVFWPLDKSWYFGLVKDYDPKTKLHHVKYDDRDEEWINLQNERFKLLLLPSEFSCKFDSEKLELKAKEENKAGILSAIDDNGTNSFLESEPIISWLARSAHQVKKSSLRILKEKRRSHLKNNLHPSQSHSVGCPLSSKSRRPSFPVMLDRSTDEKAAKLNPLKKKNCCDDWKFTIVYSRRRFHNKLGTVEDKLTQGPPWSFSTSMKLVAFAADGVGCPEECNVTFTALNQGEASLKCILPLIWLPSLAWLYENSWLYKILSLHHCGKLMIVWPVVCMEIVFLNNRRGLRFLSFSGYLQHAVAVMCLFIRIFHQPSRCTRFAELQLPFTSIGFRLSCVQGEGRQLLFYVYNFSDTESSQWLYLDHKLKQFAVTVKELPLSDCTYANVRNLFCAGEKCPFTSYFWEQIRIESLQKASCGGLIHHPCSNISASSHTSLPYLKLNGQDKNHPFLLSFATMPAMFLFSHFKMLVEKNEDSVSFKISNAMSLSDRPDNYGKFTDECRSPVEDSSDQFSETTHENFGLTLNHHVVNSGWLSCPRSKSAIDATSVGNDCDLLRSSDISVNNELNLNGDSAVIRDLGKRVCEESDSQFQRQPFSSSWRDVRHPCSPLEDISSPEESEGDCSSFLNTPKIQTQRSQSEDNMSERREHAAEKSASYLTWSANGCSNIHSPKPTAPRTMWHHNRQNHISASVVNHSKFWSEDWEGYINGYKKPRTHVSFMSSFGVSDNSPRSQSHHRKGRPYKKPKTDNANRIGAGSKSLENDLGSLTCNANVLVTAGDRGWREYSALVLLESDAHKDWQILVKISGATKYSHKAHQSWQPGTTNRFTHAMMWKGGKDWTLEFTDRSQWSLFKELYEECYNRNVRAASIRNIPIPGVHLIEDCDDISGEVPFPHNSAKYFRQTGTEIDMALDPSHVFYDMDSEDEEWFSKLRTSADDSRRMLLGISDETFEKAMDMFEKVAFEQHCNEFTDAEIESFMAEIGPVEVLKAIHKHWQQKRQKKGMPLIRQFQPALWEQYQQQVKEWESTLSKMHNCSNGSNNRAFPVEKPPMFAFCLRPRGLEVPNKGSKQRSHKKFPVNGHHNAFARENYSLQGKKLNGHSLGKEKALFTAPNCEFSDVPWLQSPTGLSHLDPASGFATFANGNSERSQHLRFERNNSKKVVMSASPRGHRTMSTTYAQRTKGSEIFRMNATGFPERPTAAQYKPDGSRRHQSDIDEFTLRDASSAAQHASNMAKLKREKAQWLIHKADLAIHRAVVAVMTADAIKASEDVEDDG